MKRVVRVVATALLGFVLFAAGMATAGVDLRKVVLKPGKCINVAKVTVCAAKARPVTVSSPRTVTSPPRTVTSPPTTVTTQTTVASPPVTVTSPPVTVATPPVTVTTPPVTVTTTPTPQVSFGGGTFRVGTDIVPGTYRNSDSSGGCYWERLRGFSGTLPDIIANDFTNDIAIVTISPSDVGFKSERCGTWSKIG